MRDVESTATQTYQRGLESGSRASRYSATGRTRGGERSKPMGGGDCWEFGVGDAPPKRHFGNESWEEVSLGIFAPTRRGTLLNPA